MFIVGTNKAWKDLPVMEGAPPVRLFIHSMKDSRRQELLSAVEHLKGEDETAPSDEWFHAVLRAFGRECIKAWTGLGAMGDDGNPYVLPCTPENIDAVVVDEAISWQLIGAINAVCKRVTEEVTAAGNVSSVGSTGTAEAAPTP